MRIRRPYGITLPQLLVVSTLGVVGGVYIWRPLILKWKNDTNKMIPIKELKRAFSTTPGMLLIAMCTTVSLTIGYRIFIKPKLNIKRRLEAEEVAEYVFQKELQSGLALKYEKSSNS